MSETDEHKPYRSTSRTIHFWAVGAIADYMMYAMFALIPIFFVNTFGMNPIMVSWALFLPRIFDGIADPLIGHWSDNTHTRWGRRRPFILVSVLVGSCLIMGLWWMSKDWGEWTQFAFVLVMSLLLFLCWGTYNMNHMALGYELSDDYHQRTQVIAVRGFYFSIAAMTGGFFYWIAGLKVFPNEITGMRIESVFIAAAAVLAALFAVMFTRERFQKANRKHVDIIQAIKATMTVKPFVILLLVRIIQTLGGTLYNSLAFYIGVYSVCQGDKHLYNALPAYNGVIGLSIAFLMVFAAARFSRLIGKRRGLIMSYGVAFLSACLIPFFAQPGWPYLLLAHMIIFQPILGSLFNVFQTAVMPDICDIDELNSGERREGLFSAVGGFVSKLENSLCSLASGYIIAFSGFDAKHAAAIPPIPQTQEVISNLRWLGFTPSIVFSGLAFVVCWYYPVTEKMMADVRAKLDERRRAGLLSEGPESEEQPAEAV